MVKGDFLWLKTLGGLEKVDILVRHVDDVYCDPLSLRPDSQLGIAGLLEVVRRGNVTIANPLGSGVLENPGLMAFMTGLCQYYLGEDLKISNIATWWCGQEKEMKYVLENLQKLVVKRIYKPSRNRTYFGWQLSQDELDNLKREIKATPYLFVGQEQAIFATSPSLGADGFEPRHTVLRGFGVAGKSGFQTLPGGFTRSAPEFGNIHVSNQSGGLGKDTWVQSEEAVTQSNFLLKPIVPRYTSLGLKKLSSGIASNMFWVGRYMVRVRLTTNLLRVILKYFTEIENFQDPNDRDALKSLLQALTHITVTYPGFVGEEGLANLESPEKEVHEMIFNPNKVGSLAYNIQMWRGAANSVRNIWSIDTWRIFDKIDRIAKRIQNDPNRSPRNLRKGLEELIDAVVAAFGFTQHTFSQEEGAPIFEIGVALEEAMMRSSLLRSTLTIREDASKEDKVLEAVLLSVSSLNTYRHRYQGEFQVAGVIELLLVNETYPGSIAASLDRIAKNLLLLPQKPRGGKLRSEQQEIMYLINSLKQMDSFKLSKTNGSDMFRNKLDHLLASIRSGLVESANSIINTFFSHTDYKTQRSEFLFDPDL